MHWPRLAASTLPAHSEAKCETVGHAQHPRPLRNLPRVVPLFASDQEPPSATRPSADDGFGCEEDGESGHWIDASPDPDATLAEIEERLQRLRSPFRTAEAFWVEEIIDPRRTSPENSRGLLRAAFRLTEFA